jgi:hypothetical protein
VWGAVRFITKKKKKFTKLTKLSSTTTAIFVGLACFERFVMQRSAARLLPRIF